jgi:pimeloyl-ACP methyl ester carboxylesterase
MRKSRGALWTTLGVAAAAAAATAAALKPEWFLAAEFNRQRALAGARRRWIEVAGHRWCYLDAGASKPPRRRSAVFAPDPPRRTIVLVHGFTGSKENWLPLMRVLARRYRVLAPDLPGWGESERHAGADYGASAQVERLAQFLRALPRIVGVEGPPALLVGHSMGGQISGLLAARHPDLLQRLVLMSASGVLFEENAFGLGVLAGENPFAVNSRADVHRYLNIVFGTPPFVPWPFDEALARRRRRDAVFEQAVLDDIGRGPDAFALQAELAAIRVPVLLLWGREDAVVDPSAMAIFSAGLNESRSVLLNGCGHMPMMERTAETAAALEDFLR